MKKIIFICCLFSSLFVWSQKTIDAVLKKYNNESIPYISVNSARELQLASEVIFLDARELKEFKTSKIPSASYIGHQKFSLDHFLKKGIKKEKSIIVYCSIGVRSEEIAEKLQKAGYVNVKNLYGGIFEWKNKNYPVLDSTETETEKVHVFSKQWGKYLEKGEKVYD